MFMYSFCYVLSVLYILFHCVVLCTVCVEMCTVLLPPGDNVIAVNKYISIIIIIIIHHNYSYSWNKIAKNSEKVVKVLYNLCIIAGFVIDLNFF